MAFTANSDLKSSPPLVFRDQQHAAKLFVPDQFRLAPKHSFLFHVAFGINQGALQNINLVQRHGQEINMLVKSTDLPSFTMQTETLNQYNRKKVVQYQAKYGEIAMKFHDDNMGLINQLWQNYFTYYYADSTSASTPGAYSRNATKPWSAFGNPYGLDNGSTAPFFNYIKIYQMARHEYVCYHLYNPMISSWNHNKLDYTNQGIHDFDMKIQYEAVSYSVGEVSSGEVEGFGQSHYDTTPSSLTGISPAANVAGPSFANGIDTKALGPGILSNAINQVNQNQNRSGALGVGDLVAGAGLLTAGIGLFNAVGGISGIGSAISGAVSAVGGAISGIADTVFPSADKNASDENSTENEANTNEDQSSDPAADSNTGDPGSPESDEAAPYDSQDGTDTTYDPGNDGWGEG